MIWIGIIIGLVVGTAFGMVSGYLFTWLESLFGYLAARTESKKSPYIKDITETNVFVAKKELEVEGKEEKVPAIGFDISPYIGGEEDDIEEEPEECENKVGFHLH